MSVSLDYYRIFYYAATYHSLNKAAAVMGSSQPNISRSIAALENQLGCRLFNRSATGVTLTDAGNDLLSHVEPALKHLRIAEEELHSAKDLKRGVLTIGISSGLTRGVIKELLAPPIDLFHVKYPDIKLEVTHHSTPHLISEIDNGLLDIAFITLDQYKLFKKNKEHPGILYSYNDIAVAGPEYSHLSGKKVSISELIKYPIIGLGDNTDTFQYYKEVFSDFGLEYRPSIRTISTDQILIYAMGNFGIGFINPDDARQGLEEGRLIEIKIKEKMPKRNISMIKNSKEKQTAVMFEQLFLSSVPSCAASQ